MGQKGKFSSWYAWINLILIQAKMQNVLLLYIVCQEWVYIRDGTV